MFKLLKNWVYTECMSKYIFIVIFCCFCLSCERSYIEVPNDVIDNTNKIKIASIYASVDFAHVLLSYDYRDFHISQGRRDLGELPPTVYDGDLVFLDHFQASLFTDQDILPDNNYFYSVFYLDKNSDWVQSATSSFSSLSYEEGMVQLLDELVVYVRSRTKLFR